MAERTLDELAGTAVGDAPAGAPSQVAGTEVEAFVRFISTHGPYKTETLLFQQAAANDFKADDTFKSQLAHPLWATVVCASDTGTSEPTFSVELTSLESNANFKTLYLRDAEGNNGLGICITVYGY
jgi:hypothetical protein